MSLNRSCLGYHCDLRDKCVHHKLPLQLHNQFFQPPETGESCHVFEAKEEKKPWGFGKDEPND